MSEDNKAVMLHNFLNNVAGWGFLSTPNAYVPS